MSRRIELKRKQWYVVVDNDSGEVVMETDDYRDAVIAAENDVMDELGVDQ